MAETHLKGPVRVRFAPSPTGYLHVGGARTAIYNDLLRQSLGGAYVLRIEDTDKARSDEAMIEQIRSALEWVGVAWDEGPVLQSAGVERHRERARELVDEGHAYRCFCTPDQLEEKRREAESAGERFQYPRTCLELAPETVERYLEEGRPHVIRFRMPDEPIAFTDLVRGDVEFPPESWDDFILLRTDGSPTYHLSVVCDDIDMGITHVVRGEDHLSNTPKHIPLFEALLGSTEQVPVFGHLPLILGDDRKRLSKRTGATSVEEFRAAGFLPQALYNFLALLGWTPGDDREILSREEMVELFTVERLNDSAAIFDREKLAWMNGQYIQDLPFEAIAPHLEPFLTEQGITDPDPDRLEHAVDLHRPRARTLIELAEGVAPYFREEIDYDPELCERFLGDPDLPAHLEQLRERYAAVEAFDLEPLEEELRGLADELDVKAGALIHPLRMALTGVKKGPGVFDVVQVTGRERTLARLERFIGFLRREGAS